MTSLELLALSLHIAFAGTQALPALRVKIGLPH
jgi:hypothetical protein